MTSYAGVSSVALLLVGCATPTVPRTIDVHMTLGQVEERVTGIGGARDEDAYPLFWASGGGKSGYHVYYELPDHSCLQVQVQGAYVEKHPELERTYPVLQFQLGPKGEPYTGKMKWFEDEKAGRLTRRVSIDLGDFARPP